MEFRTLSERQMSAFQRESSSVDAIKEHSKELVAALAKTFRDHVSAAYFHLQFLDSDDERYLCKVFTTLGVGVMRLSFDFKDDEVMGFIIVERELLDERHLPVWEPVWHIKIPSFGDIFGGDGPDPVRLSFNSHRTGAAILKLGIHIAHAIGTGPLMAVEN